MLAHDARQAQEAARSKARVAGHELDIPTMPGRRLLAWMGKRVWRPSGHQITRAMLEGLAITGDDVVAELAPGLGATTRLMLARRPAGG